MAAKKKQTDVVAPEGAATKAREAGDEGDVEGHNFGLHPTIARELARYKQADIEREARQRQLAKEARPNKQGR